MTGPAPSRGRALATPLVIAALLGGWALASTGSATAATITVDRADDPPLADTTGCSLRQAIQAANTNAAVGACTAGETAPDTVELPLSVQLSTAGADDTNQGGDLDVLAGGPLRVVGTGVAPSVITQTVTERVVHLIGATLTLERVTVAGGQATGLTPAGDGGGILLLAGSRLTLTQATVSGNTAERSGGIANGHRAIGGSGGEVVIVGSTVAANTVSASSGGGMGAGGIGNINGTLTIVNSTVSGNATAGGRGGGIYSEALTGSVSTVNIASSTITGNAGGGGGNLHNSGNGGVATMRLRSSILSAAGLTGNCGSSGGGSLTSVGFNLADDDTSCGLTEPTDRRDVDPLLGPLTAAAGGTAVHIPATGSPAIDRGTSDTAVPGVGPLSTDQRGLTRPVDFAELTNATAGDGADIGAVEVQRPPVAPATPSPPPGPGPSVVERDTSFAPLLAVKARLRVDRRRVVLLRVTCPRTEASPPCRGTATLLTRARVRIGGTRRILVLATARFTVAAGRTATLRLRLTPGRARLVAARPPARRATVVVKARDASGNRATLRRNVQVVPTAR